MRDVNTKHDALFVGARRLWWVGCFTAPGLVIRVASFTISDISFVICGIALAFTAYRPRRKPQFHWPIAAILAVVASMIAGYKSQDAAQNYLVAGRMVYLWLIWRWQARSLLSDVEFARRSIKLFVYGSAVSALASIGQVLFGVYLFGSATAGATGERAPGLAGHVDDQGGQLGVAVAFGLGLLLTSNATAPRQRTLLTAVLLSIVGLVLCGGVSGMAAASAAMVILMLRTGRKLLRIFQILALSSIGIWLAVHFQSIGGLSGGSPMTRISSAFGHTAGQASSVSDRALTWQYAWDHIRSSPFAGVGLDPESGVTYDHATLTHNIFLLYWFQGGALFIVALLLALTPAARQACHRLSGGRNSLQESALAGFIAAVIYGFVAPISYQRYFWFPVLLLIVLSDFRKESKLEINVPALRRQPSGSGAARIAGQGWQMRTRLGISRLRPVDVPASKSGDKERAR